MPWIKLNHNAPQHPKIAALSDRAFRVWIRSLCYAAEFQTDGVLPRTLLATVPRRSYEELVAVGLWLAGPDAVVIHDYLKHQTSKAKIAAERQRNAARRTGGTPAVHPLPDPAGTSPVVPEKNRDKKKEVKKVQVLPPNPPHEGGSNMRVRREHREHAKAILKARLGYCQHEPECLNQVICLDLIAHELAQKAIAS